MGRRLFLALAVMAGVAGIFAAAWVVADLLEDEYQRAEPVTAMVSMKTTEAPRA